MLIQLNAEVWMGILNWLVKYRREMAEKFGEFGDRAFSQLTQTWLHQWTRNVKLGKLHINGGLRNQLAMLNRNQMPTNITEFLKIVIRSLDAGALQFLHQVQRILANVSLLVRGTFSENFKTALRQMLPLLTNGIESFNFYDPKSEVFAFFSAEFQPQLREASSLSIFWPTPGEYHDSSLTWFFAPKMDGKSKTLYLFNVLKGLEVVQQIRENFLDPLVPSMRFFVFICSRDLATFEASTIQNEKGEQLIMEKPNENMLLIVRCPSDVGKEWLAQKFRELVDYKWDVLKRLIYIYYPDIGPNDATAGNGNVVEIG